jgi:uncharacterized protein
MASILITGGTGLIGTALSRRLIKDGHEVIVLSRSAKQHSGKLRYAQWDVEKGEIDKEALASADYIVHLAGANVAEKRWTAQRKKEIVDSRVQSGELLVKTLSEIPNRVKAVVSASAIGWYGPDPQLPNPKPFTEFDPPHNDFLGQTCVRWEAAIAPVMRLQKRLVYLRTGIVLSNEGGAYPEFKKTLPLHVASILGNGKQVVSWIHIDDQVQMYVDALFNPKWQGVYNAVAPAPASNKAIITTIAETSYKPYVTVSVPQFVLKAMLGEMSIEVLKSTTVSAEKVLGEGFQFRYPTIKEAVYNLEKK